MTRGKLWLARAGLVLVGLGVGLVVIESYFRITGKLPAERSPLQGYHVPDATLGWLGSPGHSARFRRSEFDVVITTSEEGFRKSEVPFEGDEATPGTVFLGDSFTWGWGVEQGEVFTDRLQVLDPQKRILNRGINGIGSGQQRLLLDRIFASETPERVVVMFFANDPRESIDDWRGKRPFFALENGELVPHNVPVRTPFTGPVREFAKHSRALTYLRSSLADLKRVVRAEAKIDWIERTREGFLPEGWDVCRALLVDMRDLCRERNVEFGIVFIPIAYEITVGNQVQHPLRRELGELCAGESIPWLDLTLPFHEAWKTNAAKTREGLPYYFPQDQHWTAAGHQLAAEQISKWWND